MENIRVTGTIRRSDRENEETTVTADGILMIAMDWGSPRSYTFLMGGIDWETVIYDLLLSGMPKWTIIKALLFGCKAEMHKQDV